MTDSQGKHSGNPRMGGCDVQDAVWRQMQNQRTAPGIPMSHLRLSAIKKSNLALQAQRPMSRDFVPSCYCSERRLGPHGYYGERTQEPTGQLCYPAREGALLSLDYTVSVLGKDHASFQTNQSTSQSLLGLYGILPLTNPFPRIVSWDCVPYSIRSLSQARLTDRPLSVILGPTVHASQ